MTILETILVTAALAASVVYLFRRCRRNSTSACGKSGCGCGLKLRNRKLPCAILSLLFLASHTAGAAEDQNPLEDWWRGDYAGGSWGGLRTRLADSGFTLNVEGTGDVMGNLSGGTRTGAAWLQLFQFGLDWNPEPLIPGWKGATFRASGIHSHRTRSLSLDLVGDLNGADNIEAPNGLRLYELWYQQSLWNGAFTFQLGNLLADENFAFNDFAGLFINSGFGWPQFVAANTGTVVPAFPFAAPGVRFEIVPGPNSYFQVGAYDGDALDCAVGGVNDNPYGTDFRLNRDQGVFAMAELGWRLNQQEDDTGLPGTYKIGGSYHSADFDDLYHDENGNSFIVSGNDPKSYPGNFMLYLAADQMVWHEDSGNNPTQGLGLFFRLGAGPDDRNPVHLVVDGGAQYVGPIPGRDEDALGLGFVYSRISDHQRNQEQDDRDLNGADLPAISDYELVFELTYQGKLNNWWYLQPVVQWIIHSGGSNANPDAWVVGLRTGITF